MLYLHNVLIMDDDENILKTAGRLLNRLGYEVEYAADGKSAIENYQRAMASEKPFDAVIMDLTIPGGMGGKETIQKLGVSALNTPRIKFSSNVYGWEDTLEELIEEIREETYEYLFNGKRAQLSCFGEAEQQGKSNEDDKE